MELFKGWTTISMLISQVELHWSQSKAHIFNVERKLNKKLKNQTKKNKSTIFTILESRNLQQYSRYYLRAFPYSMFNIWNSLQGYVCYCIAVKIIICVHFGIIWGYNKQNHVYYNNIRPTCVHPVTTVNHRISLAPVPSFRALDFSKFLPPLSPHIYFQGFSAKLTWMYSWNMLIFGEIYKSLERRYSKPATHAILDHL